jgi:hypothetical protein
MCASLDNLSGTLRILLETIQPPNKFGGSLKDNVGQIINSFDIALGSLKSNYKEYRTQKV